MSGPMEAEIGQVHFHADFQESCRALGKASASGSHQEELMGVKKELFLRWVEEAVALGLQKPLHDLRRDLLKALGGSLSSQSSFRSPSGDIGELRSLGSFGSGISSGKQGHPWNSPQRPPGQSRQGQEMGVTAVTPFRAASSESERELPNREPQQQDRAEVSGRLPQNETLQQESLRSQEGQGLAGPVTPLARRRRSKVAHPKIIPRVKSGNMWCLEEAFNSKMLEDDARRTKPERVMKPEEVKMVKKHSLKQDLTPVAPVEAIPSLRAVGSGPVRITSMEPAAICLPGQMALKPATTAAAGGGMDPASALDVAEQVAGKLHETLAHKNKDAGRAVIFQPQTSMAIAGRAVGRNQSAQVAVDQIAAKRTDHLHTMSEHQDGYNPSEEDDPVESSEPDLMSDGVKAYQHRAATNASFVPEMIAKTGGIGQIVWARTRPLRRCWRRTRHRTWPWAAWIGTMFSRWSMQACGVMPIRNSWPFMSMLYQLVVAGLLVVAGAQVVYSAITKVPGFFAEFLWPQYIAEAIVALCSSLTIVSSTVWKGCRSLDRTHAALARFSRARHILNCWAWKTCCDTLAILLLCLGVVAWRCQQALPIDDLEKDDQVRRLIAFTFCSTALLLGPCQYALRVARGLEGAVDAFVAGMFAGMDPISGSAEWKLIVALIRETSSKLETSFAILQGALISLVIVAMFGILRGTQRLPSLGPSALVGVGIFYTFFRLAGVTDRCNRVGPMLTQLPEKDQEIEEAGFYLIHRIQLSQTGFYLLDVRLTSGLIMKALYLTSAAAAYVAARV